MYEAAIRVAGNKIASDAQPDWAATRRRWACQRVRRERRSNSVAKRAHTAGSMPIAVVSIVPSARRKTVAAAMGLFSPRFRLSLIFFRRCA